MSFNIIRQWANYQSGQYFQVIKNNSKVSEHLECVNKEEKSNLNSIFLFTAEQLNAINLTEVDKEFFKKAIINVNSSYESAYKKLGLLKKIIYIFLDLFGFSFISTHRKLVNQLQSMKKIAPKKKVSIDFEKFNLGINGYVQFDIKKIENLFLQDKKFLGNICESNRKELEGLKVPFDLVSCSSDHLQGSSIQLGRSKDYIDCQITEKIKKEFEPDDAFEKEAKMQLFLQSKKEKWGLKSKIPAPLYYSNDKLYYRRTDGYHSYLTDIKDQNEFEASLKICAHDLGILLKQGIAYAELISVFHGTTTNAHLTTGNKEMIHISHSDTDKKEKENIARFYTLFPKTVGAYARATVEEKVTKGTARMGGGTGVSCAGKIDFVCSLEHHLYPDCGRDGLRDLGDFVWIDQHFQEIQKLPGCERFNESAAIAHFASLYQMVFLLIIAKRAQALEAQGMDSAQIWKSTSQSFKLAMESFLVAFQPENPLLGKLEEIADWKRFERQVQFCFTTKDREKECGWEHREEGYFRDDAVSYAKERIPSQSTIKKIWGSQCTWNKSFARFIEAEQTTGYSTLKGFEDGHLGNYSGPNPLFDGVRAIYNMVYFILENNLAEMHVKE